MSDPDEFLTPRQRRRLARASERMKNRLERMKEHLAMRNYRRSFRDRNPRNDDPLMAEEKNRSDSMNYPAQSHKRRLYRSDNSVFLGVCGGIAEYFDFAPWGVRWFFIILQFTGVGWLLIPTYIVLAIILKKAPRSRAPFPTYEDEDFYNAYQSSRSEALRKAKNAFDALDKRRQRMESVVTDRNFGLEEEYKNL